MAHVNDGILRRSLDDPQALTLRDASHVKQCSVCLTRRDEFDAARQFAQSVLAPSTTTIDPRTALATFNFRLAGQPQRWHERTRTSVTRFKTRTLQSLATAGAAAAVTGTLLFTPAGAFASNFLDLFQPSHVAVLPISRGELNGLPSMSDFGHGTQQKLSANHQVASLQQAASETGLTVLQPAQLPANVTGSPHYVVAMSASSTFTFDAATAQAAAAKAGKTAAPMPANINGATLTMLVHPAVTTIYGPVPSELTVPTGATKGAETASLSRASLPTLVIVEMASPAISTSSGVTLNQIEQYVLGQPGVSPDLAAQLRALGDPSTVIPIPIPINQAAGHAVTVQGVDGVAVADSTNVGGGVVWVKGGVIYAVLGQMNETALLSVANSLH